MRKHRSSGYVAIQVQETAKPASKKSIRSPEDVISILPPNLSSAETEHLVVILIDSASYLIAAQTIAIGSVNVCRSTPSDIYREAIRHNASAVVLVHNHPSGNPEPSPEDLRITRNISAAGQLLAISLLDHIILTPTSYTSLRARGHDFTNSLPLSEIALQPINVEI